MYRSAIINGKRVRLVNGEPAKRVQIGSKNTWVVGTGAKQEVVEVAPAAAAAPVVIKEEPKPLTREQTLAAIKSALSTRR